MKLFWCNINNFGDALNQYIFKNCFNIDIEYSQFYTADATGIGSVLESTFWSIKDLTKILNYFPVNKPVYVLSSGLGWETEHYRKKFRFFYNTITKRKIIPIGLRGKLTEDFCRNTLKLDTSKTILGDLGLLSSNLISDKHEKIHDIGICPHYADMQDPIFQKIISKNPNSIIISSLLPPIDFLNQLSKCKTIVSTGMHPLIAADSLGIPNIWARISEKTTTKFKFYDYYSIYDVNVNPVNLYESEIHPDLIIENYQIDKNKVEEIKNNLFNKYKKFLRENII